MQQSTTRLLFPALSLSLLASLATGCGGGDAPETPTDPQPVTETPETPPEPEAPADPMALPDDLPSGLLLGYSDFAEDDNGNFTQLQPARLEILTRRGGSWQVEVVSDEESNVFHKAMVIDPAVGEPGILTAGGEGAHVKLWRRSGGAWTATPVWHEDFGGTVNRMRDIEIGDLFGDGKPAIAVATHNQGVVAVLRQGDDGAWTATELDREADTFVHEIELGDLNGDGTLEIYATPSEPNRLEGGEQHGEVVRYVATGGASSRTVVADLGNRHAKEIWVGDADGDGRDELYVAVEALMNGNEIQEPVEIRRYDADTPADAGVVIARIQDRQCRFLTVGDFDGDGKKEMIAAAMTSGLWLLSPGTDPRGEWSTDRIERDSGGFEHASIAADLDGDGTDELYVAADTRGELRRYVWVNGRPRREMIHSRAEPRQRMMWNLMPAPVSLTNP